MVILALLSLKNYLMVVQYKSVAHLPMLMKPTVEHFICYAVNNKIMGIKFKCRATKECEKNP
jgi:hypothetical protein